MKYEYYVYPGRIDHGTGNEALVAWWGVLRATEGKGRGKLETAMSIKEERGVCEQSEYDPGKLVSYSCLLNQ